jgi:hypothetical protein
VLVPQSFGGEDGIGGVGLLKYPSDVAVSAGGASIIVVADTGNHRYVCEFWLEDEMVHV